MVGEENEEMLKLAELKLMLMLSEFDFDDASATFGVNGIIGLKQISPSVSCYRNISTTAAQISIIYIQNFIVFLVEI